MQTLDITERQVSFSVKTVRPKTKGHCKVPPTTYLPSTPRLCPYCFANLPREHKHIHCDKACYRAARKEKATSVLCGSCGEFYSPEDSGGWRYGMCQECWAENNHNGSPND